MMEKYRSFGNRNDRQPDRKTDRQTDRQKLYRLADRQTDRQINCYIHISRQEYIHIKFSVLKYFGWTDGRTGRPVGREKNKKSWIWSYPNNKDLDEDTENEKRNIQELLLMLNSIPFQKSSNLFTSHYLCWRCSRGYPKSATYLAHQFLRIPTDDEDRLVYRRHSLKNRCLENAVIAYHAANSQVKGRIRVIPLLQGRFSKASRLLAAYAGSDHCRCRMMCPPVHSLSQYPVCRTH